MSIMTDAAPTHHHGQTLWAGGIDTHRDFHVVVVIDHLTRVVDTRRFDANPAGDAQAIAWLSGLGVRVVGVEGTASYGLTIARELHAAGIEVLEVTRPNRQDRRARGKSDDIDAHNAAKAALARVNTAPMKHETRGLDQLRVRHGLRNSAVRARTAVVNEIWSFWSRVFPTTRPKKMTKTLAKQLAAGDSLLALAAARVVALDAEIAAHSTHIEKWLRTHHSDLLAVFGVGPVTASTLLLTAGNNPERLTTEASFARLCGVAPIPASSGRNQHARLHRGGDRQANSAIHIIAHQRRMHDPRTQAYLQRLADRQKKPRAAMRCLKRAITRELFKILRKTIDNQ